ncbi:MAG TPA: nuclear transport factor 2 family protein, partial [Burkholderiaceae bacterium]|nr:nuclear transport factor 2 family protein [Burkholderiaceae bacterium]
LRLLNDQYIRSVATSDAGWFERHLSADFLNSNPDGTLSDRAAFLQHVARPSTVIGLTAEDVRIRLFGETAIVHGRTTYLKADGLPGAGRYTDVWARSGDKWLCVAADVTRC